MTYELVLDVYQGPLEKLLELIEREELPVSQVSLAKVTGDFLEYVRTLEEGQGAPSAAGTAVAQSADPELLADFLVVASKLILIKSKALLPSLEVSPEEAEDMRDLELRLVLYREFKATQGHVRRMWHAAPRMSAREFLGAASLGFLPPSGVGADDLAASVRRVVGELEKLIAPTASIRVEFLNLKAKIEEVLQRLTSGGSANFSSLANGTGERSELITLFLAVLHLVNEQLVNVEQGAHFTDMWVRRTHHETIARRREEPVQ